MTDDQTKAEPDEDFDGSAGDAQPHEIEYLFAHTANGVTIEDDGRISLNSVSPTTLFFSDRPDRVTGHITTEDFIAQWGTGDDSFADDPPNAVLSLFEDEHVSDVVVVLRDPVLSDGNLSYSVEVTDGELVATSGPASLFIDRLGRPLSPMSVAGVRRRGRRRGRRRVRRRMR